jgi:hypothetical protein
MTLSTQAAQEPSAEDGLDRLLREYFGTMLPRTFPLLPLGAVAPIAALRLQPRSPLGRGRLILAACVVALLLGFGYLLSSASPGAGQKPVGIGNGSTATGGPPHETSAKR